MSQDYQEHRHQEQRPSQQEQRPQRTDLNTPKRLRYSYGMLLDKFHFELEQQYLNNKRWLLNRLVLGPGVVCGLDVQLGRDKKSVVVLPGLAIDRCGREIIVTRQSEPVVLPIYAPPGSNAAQQAQQPPPYGQHHYRDHCEEEFVHIVLCYRECASDPVPVMVGNCETDEVCAASTIREQYEIKRRDGKAPGRRSEFPDVIEGRRINHEALVEYITRPCRGLPDDCCLPLANVRVREEGEKYEPDDININIRPIVYSPRVLFQLLRSLTEMSESEY
jgi:hypothetical protein